MLQRLLRGRITFIPNGGYTFEAPTRFDQLFSGIAVPRPSFIEYGNRGVEHLTPEDTFDADYGQLLERVCKVTVRGGAPCTTRTCDLLVRSQTLYPAELRARG